MKALKTLSLLAVTLAVTAGGASAYDYDRGDRIDNREARQGGGPKGSALRTGRRRGDERLLAMARAVGVEGRVSCEPEPL